MFRPSFILHTYPNNLEFLLYHFLVAGVHFFRLQLIIYSFSFVTILFVRSFHKLSFRLYITLAFWSSQSQIYYWHSRWQTNNDTQCKQSIQELTRMAAWHQFPRKLELVTACKFVTPSGRVYSCNTDMACTFAHPRNNSPLYMPIFGPYETTIGL